MQNRGNFLGHFDKIASLVSAIHQALKLNQESVTFLVLRTSLKLKKFFADRPSKAGLCRLFKKNIVLSHNTLSYKPGFSFVLLYFANAHTSIDY